MAADILLTHGFFLNEDEKERQIMRPYPPLGLLYLSGYLKRAGFKPEILDTTFSNRKEIYSRFCTDRPCNVGIYATHMTRKSVADMVVEAKNQGCVVILGGPDSANHAENYLALGADIVVVGEGEETLRRLLIELEKGSAKKLDEIPGIVFQGDNGEVVRTEPSRMLDIDSLPWPDREGIDLGPYFAAWSDHHGVTSVNVITSRGCPYQCRWCSHAVFGNTHRRRNPVDCAEEVEHIKRLYNPDRLWYVDDVFTLEHEWLFQFAEELKRRDVKIPFETISRADRLLDESVSKTLADMGCFRIWIGSESGSDRILKEMRRGVTSKQIRKATKLVRNNGIQAGWFLMWGYEKETAEDIQATVEHVKRGAPDIFFTTLVYPIKGTPYHETISEKIEAPEDWVNATDKDNVVRGRPPESVYKLADRWLKDEVAAFQMASSDPERGEKQRSAQKAREEFFSRFESHCEELDSALSGPVESEERGGSENSGSSGFPDRKS